MTPHQSWNVCDWKKHRKRQTKRISALSSHVHTSKVRNTKLPTVAISPSMHERKASLLWHFHERATLALFRSKSIIFRLLSNCALDCSCPRSMRWCPRSQLLALFFLRLVDWLLKISSWFRRCAIERFCSLCSLLHQISVRLSSCFIRLSAQLLTVLKRYKRTRFSRNRPDLLMVKFLVFSPHRQNVVPMMSKKLCSTTCMSVTWCIILGPSLTLCFRQTRSPRWERVLSLPSAISDTKTTCVARSHCCNPTTCQCLCS